MEEKNANTLNPLSSDLSTSLPLITVLTRTGLLKKKEKTKATTGYSVKKMEELPQFV